MQANARKAATREQTRQEVFDSSHWKAEKTHQEAFASYERPGRLATPQRASRLATSANLPSIAKLAERRQASGL